jgi:hypothetical protein
VLSSATADANGHATFNPLRVPGSASGLMPHLQAISIGTTSGRASTVVMQSVP